MLCFSGYAQSEVPQRKSCRIIIAVSNFALARTAPIKDFPLILQRDRPNSRPTFYDVRELLNAHAVPLPIESGLSCDILRLSGNAFLRWISARGESQEVSLSYGIARIASHRQYVTCCIAELSGSAVQTSARARCNPGSADDPYAVYMMTHNRQLCRLVHQHRRAVCSLRIHPVPSHSSLSLSFFEPILDMKAMLCREVDSSCEIFHGRAHS